MATRGQTTAGYVSSDSPNVASSTARATEFSGGMKIAECD